MGEERGLAGRILAQHGADPDHVRSYVTGTECQEEATGTKAPGFWSRLFRAGRPAEEENT